MNIKRYGAEYLQEWNTFLETAKNRHFFFIGRPTMKSQANFG